MVLPHANPHCVEPTSVPLGREPPAQRSVPSQPHSIEGQKGGGGGGFFTHLPMPHVPGSVAWQYSPVMHVDPALKEKGLQGFPDPPPPPAPSTAPPSLPKDEPDDDPDDVPGAFADDWSDAAASAPPGSVPSPMLPSDVT